MSKTTHGKSNIGFVLGLMVSTVLNIPDSTAAEIGYSGRLIEESGKSIDGPLDFTVRFYNTASNGDVVGPTLKLANTELIDGVFQLSLDLDNSQLSAVFGDGSKAVFIEIEANGKTYPRQRFVALPLALRVPVDTNSLSYNNDGKLTVDRVNINQVSGLSAALAAKADTSFVATSSVKMANNLSDLTSPATARTNLGLGSLATASSISNADISPSAAIADSKLGTISTAGKVSGSAITSGTIAGNTAFNSSGSITSTGNFVVNGTGSATTELRFNDNDNSNYVGFKSPANVTTNKIWTLPAADGTNGQLLKTDGSGTLSWISATGGGDLYGANNLSDLTNTGTARTNLGLGNLATNSSVTSSLITDGTIVDADISASAAIADTKLATISTAGKVSGSAITSGTIGGSTVVATIGQLSSTGNIRVSGTGITATELRFGDNDDSNYVGLKAPGTVSVNKIWTLPAVDGTANQALSTDGSGVLQWVTPMLGSQNLSDLGNASTARTNLGLGSLATNNTVTSALITDGAIVDADINASAAIADTKLATISTAGKVSGSAITSGTIGGSTVINSSGTITSSAAITGTGNIIVNGTGAAATELRFNDDDNSNYVGFKSPGTVSTNKIWTLPAADGTNGQLLKTDGSGALSWVSAGGGGDLFAANNLSELANAGTARTNLGLGTLATNSAVTSALITDGTIVDVDINASAAIADTKLATISTAGKVSGSAITSGTIGGSTVINSSGTITTSAAITGTGNIIVNGTGAAATELRFNDNDNSSYVGFKSPATVSTNKIWTLPAADGTNGFVLQTDGSGTLSWITNSPTVALPSGVSGTLPVANGGSGATSFTSNGILFGSGSSPVSATAAGVQYNVLTAGAGGTPAFGSVALNQSAAVSGTLPVGNGGTGLTTGTSGGVPYFSAASTLASSAALTANGVMLGGGAGASPTATAAGAAYQPLRVPSGGGAPVFGALDLSQSAAVTNALTVANGGTGLTTGTSGGLPYFSAAGTMATSAALTAKGIVLGGGAGATPYTTAAMTNGQLLVGSTGDNPVPTTLTSGSNAGVTITNAAGSITLDTPQDIRTSASPSFVGLNLSGSFAVATQVAGTGDGTGTPVGGTVRAASASGTNIAGTNLTINAGNGTGTGGSGTIIMQTAAPGGSGATADTYKDWFRLTNAGSFIFGAGEGTGTVSSATMRGPAATGSNIAGANLTVAAGNGTGTGGSGSILFQTAPTGSTGSTANTLATALAITAAGNVGIGTTTPGERLDLGQGNLRLYTPSGQTGYIDVIEAGATTEHMGIAFDMSSTNKMYFTANSSSALPSSASAKMTIDASTGNVGIGTISPGSLLDVAGTIRTSGITSPGASSHTETFGSGATATSNYAIALGKSAAASGWGSIAAGASSVATGDGSIAIGLAADAGGGISGSQGSIAIGNNTSVSGSDSIVIGAGATTSLWNTLVIGGTLQTISAGYFGNGVTSASPSSFTLQPTGGSGTDIQGGSLTLAAGKGTGTGGSGNILFQTAPTGSTGSTANTLATAMAITAAGNVGIGTTSPQVKLQVQDGTIGSTSYNTRGSYLLPYNPTQSWKSGLGVNLYHDGTNYVTRTDFTYNSASAVLGDHSGALKFYTLSSSGNTDRTLDNTVLETYLRMTISAGGNVGIGTTAPGAPIEVVGATGTTTVATFRSNPNATGSGALAALKLDNTYGAGNFKTQIEFNASDTSKWALGSDFNGNGSQNFYIYDGPNNTARFWINSTGNVGIGTTSPSYKLHVVGTAGLSTGTSWTNASDIRLKDIERDYEYGLAEIEKLHTIRYRYKQDNPLNLPSDHKMIGFIAQEVRKVIPDAVITRPDGYLELNVDPIHWAMVNAVKELAAENVRLKAELAALKAAFCSKFSDLPICDSNPAE